MWEVKSMGTTVELTRDHYTATLIFTRCYGSYVVLLEYDSRGNKRVVDRRSFHRNSVSSHQPNLR